MADNPKDVVAYLDIEAARIDAASTETVTVTRPTSNLAFDTRGVLYRQHMQYEQGYGEVWDSGHRLVWLPVPTLSDEELGLV